jgi:hypothetical protein
VCSVQLEADHSDTAMVVGGLPTGAPMAANYEGGVDEARSSEGTAWYKKHDGMVGLGGGRPEETERRWPWSSVG